MKICKNSSKNKRKNAQINICKNTTAQKRKYENKQTRKNTHTHTHTHTQRCPSLGSICIPSPCFSSYCFSRLFLFCSLLKQGVSDWISGSAPQAPRIVFVLCFYVLFEYFTISTWRRSRNVGNVVLSISRLAQGPKPLFLTRPVRRHRRC